MAKKYFVRHGYVVRVDERTTHEGGAVVELDEETAAAHAHKIEPYNAELHAPLPLAPEEATAPEEAQPQSIERKKR